MSKETPTHLFRSRLVLWPLLCTVVLALVFSVVGYTIINSAETKAKREFVRTRQELINARLYGMHVDIYRSNNGSYEVSASMRESLKQLLLRSQLSYLIILDKEGVPVAEVNSGFDREPIHSLASSGALHRDLPFYEYVEIDGYSYLNCVMELQQTDGLKAVYGISEMRLGDVGDSLSGVFIGIVVAGFLVLLFPFIFAVFYFVMPLRRMKQSLQDENIKADVLQGAERNDELGEVWRLALDLRRERHLFSQCPTLNAGDAINAVVPVFEQFATAMLLVGPDGTVRASNIAMRKILDEESIAPHVHIVPLMEKILNAAQREEFRQHFDFLPGLPEKSIELVLEDKDGVHNYELWLSMHSVVGEPCVLCAIYDVSNEFRLRQLVATASVKLEKAIQERTEELVKVNEQLRQENAERRAIEQALVRAESRYREIVNNSIEGIVQRTADGRLLSANASMARILGYSSVDELLDAYQKPGKTIAFTSEMEVAITELLEIRGWVSNLEFQALMQDKSAVWVAMNARRVADSAGETLYYEAFIEDITSRKKTEEKLVYQAFHDPLTGLPNRALFLDRLRMALRRTKRHDEYLFAVLYLDLDRFKNINDSFGHSAGDKMLNHATEKLLQCVREGDTVARFGGDEFAVLLVDLEKPSQAVLIAKRISDALSETVSFHGQDVSIGASIGIVLNNADYANPDEVLRDADTAMYRSKMQGRRIYTVFNERMREETIAALALESDLRGAAERGEIEAFYQPLVDISTGNVSGFEALMRWRRGNEIVSPVVFIPIAEESGIIYDLGLEMMRIVARQVVEWTVLMGHCDFSVHVNISSKQLMATSFWRDVQEVLIETGVNPRQLIFEITESVFLDYGSRVISIMNMVRDFGISFCLDDFGTGFSSLSYLRMLPLESLKVDRSFIVDITSDNYSEAILRNLISMGNDLGLKVITEGVDQPSQVDVLRDVGCRYAQGFFFAKPMPASEAIEYMKKNGMD